MNQTNSLQIALKEPGVPADNKAGTCVFPQE